MVLHRVGSAAGLVACAGSSPALSAVNNVKIRIGNFFIRAGKTPSKLLWRRC